MGCPTRMWIAILVSFVGCFYLYVDCSHQNWWFLGCSCKPWYRREKARDMILNMYRGLFLSPKHLRRLPVIKPFSKDRRHQKTYISNTITTYPRRKNSCCNTEYAFEVINRTVSNTRRLRVVHFDSAFQFVPTGRCMTNVTCGKAKCLQMYRHHWMLVWDEILPYYPPVTFVPVEIPSHCECVNVGT